MKEEIFELIKEFDTLETERLRQLYNQKYRKEVTDEDIKNIVDEILGDFHQYSKYIDEEQDEEKTNRIMKYLNG